MEEARASVPEQPVAHLDETSWREGSKRAWLWVAVTSLVTVFVVRLSRGGQVARELQDRAGLPGAQEPADHQVARALVDFGAHELVPNMRSMVASR